MKESRRDDRIFFFFLTNPGSPYFTNFFKISILFLNLIQLHNLSSRLMCQIVSFYFISTWIFQGVRKNDDKSLGSLTCQTGIRKSGGRARIRFPSGQTLTDAFASSSPWKFILSSIFRSLFGNPFPPFLFCYLAKSVFE